MSRPGDPGRRQEFAERFDAIIAKTAQLVGELPGARGFEIGYTAVDGTELPDGYEPADGEPVWWYAEVERRRRLFGRQVTERIRGEATGTDTGGPIGACVALLEKLGVNVVLLDLPPGTDLLH